MLLLALQRPCRRSCFAGSALAAFTPALAIGHQPPTLGIVGTTVVPPDRPAGRRRALQRAAIYVPAGYTATLGQAPGTSIGTATAQILVREPIAGAVLPLTGTRRRDRPGEPSARRSRSARGTAPSRRDTGSRRCRPPARTSTCRCAIDPAPAALSIVASYVMTFCLPNPNIPLEQGGATVRREADPRAV